MVASLVDAFKPVMGRPHPIQEIVLQPSAGGRFEVTVDGDLIYSKAETGQHTTNEQIIELVRPRIKPEG